MTGSNGKLRKKRTASAELCFQRSKIDKHLMIKGTQKGRVERRVGLDLGRRLSDDDLEELELGPDQSLIRAWSGNKQIYVIVDKLLQLVDASSCVEFSRVTGILSYRDAAEENREMQRVKLESMLEFRQSDHCGLGAAILSPSVERERQAYRDTRPDVMDVDVVGGGATSTTTSRSAVRNRPMKGEDDDNDVEMMEIG